MTEDEKINMAVSQVMRTYPPVLKSIVSKENGARVGRWYRPEHPIPYNSVNEFKQINRNCCQVTDMEPEKIGGKISVVSKALGLRSSNVRVEYLVRYEDESGKPVEEKNIVYFSFSNCRLVD